MHKYAKYVVLVVCLATFFVNNRVILPDIMESRNIVTAREMVYDGHWLIPTMNGDLRLEKPPLPTWVAAVAQILSPDDIGMQRLMAGLAALVLVLFFWRFAEKILHANPIIATLLLCTSYNVILMGRTASWDIYCHAFMMGGIYFLAEALSDKSCRWRCFLLSGVFIGLSLMSKGPVSLYALFLPFLLCFLFAYRPSAKGKGWGIVLCVVVALAVGTWWYAYVNFACSDALAGVVSKETGSWVNHNVRPWYYYWKFFLETGVWSLLLLTAIFFPVFSKKGRRQEVVFSVMWIVCMLVLLSFLPEKKSRYLLPMLIPAAYAMAFVVEQWQKSFTDKRLIDRASRWIYRVNAWLVALAIVFLIVASNIFLYQKGIMSLAVWLLFSVLFVCVAAYIVYNSTAKMRPFNVVYAVVFLFVAAECFALPYVGKIVNNPERNSIEATRYNADLAPLSFYYNDKDELRIEIVYAAHKNIRPLNFSDKQEIMQKLPCVVLTHGRVGEEMSAEIINDIDTLHIGLYDDNRYPKSSRRHRAMFVYNVTMLTAKDAKNNNH